MVVGLKINLNRTLNFDRNVGNDVMVREGHENRTENMHMGTRNRKLEWNSKLSEGDLVEVIYCVLLECCRKDNFGRSWGSKDRKFKRGIAGGDKRSGPQYP